LESDLEALIDQLIAECDSNSAARSLPLDAYHERKRRERSEVNTTASTPARRRISRRRASDRGR
jgi:hypothetical protein